MSAEVRQHIITMSEWVYVYVAMYAHNIVLTAFCSAEVLSAAY